MPQPESQRDYFAELYVAGIFGDAGWAVYFPKRDVGFDFIVSRAIGESTLIRPVQVKGLYPTALKKDKDVYGFSGALTAVHPDMVLALPFFAAKIRGVAPACIAYMPRGQVRPRSKGGFRSVPCRLTSGIPQARPEFAKFIGEAGLLAVSDPSWGASAV
jgi:hypothetical protein